MQPILFEWGPTIVTVSLTFVDGARSVIGDAEAVQKVGAASAGTGMPVTRPTAKTAVMISVA